MNRVFLNGERGRLAEGNHVDAPHRMFGETPALPIPYRSKFA